MNVLASTVQRELTTAIAEDRLQLPTLPEVALRVREAAQDRNVDARMLAGVISEDPALSGRVMRVANSALMRGTRVIEDLQTAISRLGIDFTANLVTGYAMKQMFQATSELVDKRLRAIWAHATEVAAISTVLCKHYSRLRPDQAMLAGLTHSVGALPVLTWAEEHESLVRDGITLDHLIDTVQAGIGERILMAWEFPPELCVVPVGVWDFKRASPKLDYCDIVTVANLQSLAGTGHPCNDYDWSTIPAFDRLGLEPDQDVGEIEDLSDDMAAAMECLS